MNGNWLTTLKPNRDIVGHHGVHPGMFIATFKKGRMKIHTAAGKIYPDALDACNKHFPTYDLHFLLMARESADYHGKLYVLVILFYW